MKIKCKKIKISKIDIILYIFSTFWIIFSFFNDFKFFNFSYTERVSYYISSGNPNSIAFYILLKIIFIVLVYLFTFYISNLIKKVRKKDKRAISLIKIYLILLLVYGIVLLLIYPGIWYNNGMDEFQVFDFARNLQVQYHQGVITSMLYILGLMIFPRPVFVVLLQVIIGILLLGNIILDIAEQNKAGKILLFLLLFSPATLYFANYPLRAYLFAVFFLAFIHYFIKYRNQKNIKLSSFWFITFLLCIIINFRIEALALIFIYPFLFIKKIPCKQIIYSTIVLIFSVFSFSMINKLGYQGAYRSHNSLSLVAPIGLYLKDESRYNPAFENDIKAIDKVYDTALLKKYADTNYIGGARLDQEYTEKDYKKYLLSATKIIIHNPDLFFYQKFIEATHSLGLSSIAFVSKSLDIEECSKIGVIFPENFNQYFAKSEPYFRDFNIDSHNMFTKILGGQFYILNVHAYSIFYAFWIPILVLLAIAIYGIIKKNMILLTADGIIILHFILTFLTAPTRFQMYYFPEYLVGWYLFIYVICYYNIGKRKIKNKR